MITTDAFAGRQRQLRPISPCLSRRRLAL